MTMPQRFRSLIAFTLVVGLFIALPGCGGEKVQADKKGDTKENPKTDAPQGGNSGPSKTEPVKAEILDLSSGVGKDAVDFLQAVRAGTAKADQLSTGFVKLIGLPAELPSDKAKGYSADAAEGWLKRVGSGVGFGPPLKSVKTPDTAIIRGLLIGKPGAYSLRMVRDGNAWKVDWLSVSSVDVKAISSSADAVLPEFAATAIIEAVCDKDAMPPAERTLTVAAGLLPAFRTKLAPPFGSDRDQGFDFNRGALALEIAKLGDKAESVTLTPQGNDAYKVEVTRAGAKAAYTIKLVKGSVPGQWLVESISSL